jgi:undecaprenyl phosphate-alpha-L-ara4N flippase subunit ArnF
LEIPELTCNGALLSSAHYPDDLFSNEAFSAGAFMHSYAFGLGFALVTAIIVILGDLALKFAADRQHTVASILVAAGVVAYALSALLWFAAMRHVSLGQAAVAYSMFTLVALVLLGAFLFAEPLRFREFAAIGCALLAMALMSRAT